MSNLTKLFFRVVLGFLCCILLTMPMVSAESLWSDSGRTANLFADHKARNVGDILTIIISENSSAKRAGNAKNSKNTSADMNVDVGIFGKITKALGISSSVWEANSKNSDSFKADGSISNTNNVTARMTAQVTEVKPNGDFVILGKQDLAQNGEEQTITVSGIVRTDDITPENTVLSSAIGNAQIKIDGKGPIARKQRQGIITQLLNIFF